MVSDWYVDAFRKRRSISAATRAAVLGAMGIDPEHPHPPPSPVDPVRLLRRRGERVSPPAELVLEDGTSLGTLDRLPDDLPHGYHRLRRDAGDQLLIAAPRRARAPVGRTWGWAAQLYAVRSRESWGIGDLADLRALGSWAAGQGAATLLINPLNAPNPGPDPDPSPYFPSTRRFRDPIYLRIEEVPGAGSLAGELAALARHARGLNQDRRVHRVPVLAAKREALERIWRRADRSDPGFSTFRAAGGEALRRWSVFAALSERHGAGWQRWPEPLRDPGSPEVARFTHDAADRVAFHAWAQWLIDEQLRRAGEGAGIVGDLPVGFDPGGFDAWDWQAELANGARIGSPPDQFNPAGQDWGLPPFVPHRLRAAGYRPLIETLRAALRHATGLRIDHVLGLFRTWWVPNGFSAADGAYVPAHADELLAILALESERAGAIILGEDLGTVGAGVRRSLAARGILSTRVAYFERRIDRVPALAQLSVTTHDLPTIAGAWSGADAAELDALGVARHPVAEARLRRRLSELSGLPPDAPVSEVILATHRSLASSSAAIVTATLEDALVVSERPNVPGTGSEERPNWSLALPVPLETLLADPLAGSLASTFGESQRAFAHDSRDVDSADGAQDR